MVDAFVPVTFVGNHDVTRIASQLTDPRPLLHAVVLLATLPGHPVVYSGDELGLEAIKEERLGGDDAIRSGPSSRRSRGCRRGGRRRCWRCTSA